MIKRIFDIFISLVGLIILGPFFVLIAAWVKLDTQGPVFFRQIRVGKNGREFRIHKFRTMVNDAENKGEKITVGNDKRITKSGKFLRKHKLDELPQLLDVLYGDMSLVGPRPEVPEYMNVYPNDLRHKVLSVKPGITDQASIEMKDENQLLSRYADPKKAYIEEILPIKQKYYLSYVENRNLLLDIQIILKTIYQIFLK